MLCFSFRHLGSFRKFSHASFNDAREQIFCYNPKQTSVWFGSCFLFVANGYHFLGVDAIPSLLPFHSEQQSLNVLFRRLHPRVAGVFFVLPSIYLVVMCGRRARKVTLCGLFSFDVDVAMF